MERRDLMERQLKNLMERKKYKRLRKEIEEMELRKLEEVRRQARINLDEQNRMKQAQVDAVERHILNERSMRVQNPNRMSHSISAKEHTDIFNRAHYGGVRSVQSYPIFDNSHSKDDTYTKSSLYEITHPKEARKKSLK